MIVLPEGHRTLDGQLRLFKKLPFHLAKEASVEILPIGLSGLFYLKAKKSWLIKPTHVKVKFGSPISPETIQKLDVEQELQEDFNPEVPEDDKEIDDSVDVTQEPEEIEEEVTDDEEDKE